MVQALVSAKSWLQHVNRHGQTLLVAAGKAGHPGVVELLLQLGVHKQTPAPTGVHLEYLGWSLVVCTLRASEVRKRCCLLLLFFILTYSLLRYFFIGAGTKTDGATRRTEKTLLSQLYPAVQEYDGSYNKIPETASERCGSNLIELCLLHLGPLQVNVDAAACCCCGNRARYARKEREKNLVMYGPDTQPHPGKWKQPGGPRPKGQRP